MEKQLLKKFITTPTMAPGFIPGAFVGTFQAFAAKGLFRPCDSAM